MLIQLFLFIFAGIFFGTLTGLIPGIHINLVSIFIISASATLLSINPIYLVIFITSMAITHTFIDFIPSIFLGCPDTDTELSILPGHELLKQGHGYQAILLTCYGSLAAIFILLLIAFPSTILISTFYPTIQKYIPYFLILISIFLISIEKNKIPSFVIFILAGILGFATLNLSVIKEPLLPLLTGLFGSSLLITSIKNKTKIPKQKIIKPKTSLTRPLLGALIASPLCSFLPGLGSGQASIIGNIFTKNSQKQFLVLIGATNTLVMGFSFLSLYIISKTRTGAAVAIQQIIQTLNYKTLILILSTSLIVGIFSFFLTIFLAKLFSNRLDKLNYFKINISTLIFLTILIFFISNIYGILVFILATLLGIFCISIGARKTNMMGCLLIPTIIWYLFF